MQGIKGGTNLMTCATSDKINDLVKCMHWHAKVMMEDLHISAF